jgi:DNA-binding MarR family transcriptional regulator
VYIVHIMNEHNQKVIEEPLSYQTQRLQDLLREIHRCCQDRMLIESQKFNLPQAELRCLMFFDGERYLTVKGLAKKMDVAKSRITKIVDGLIDKGLVQRIDDPRDGRVRLISLTRKGAEKSEQIDSFLKDIHRRILLQMEPTEKQTILSSLEFLRSCMETVKGQLK